MSTYGCHGSGHLSYVEQLNISYVPKEFQFDSSQFDSRFKFVGAAHNRKSRTGTWKNRSADGKPVLLISENTGSGDDGFLKLCIEAFGGSQYHVVLSKVLDSPGALAVCLPENFEINRETFNCEILPFASVMLCQGGMGTTLESLYHGVPVVAVPSNPFNAEVAYRLAELGVGLHLPQRGTIPNALREAVDLAASNTALRSRVKKFQSDLENGSGVKEAADFIEEYISSGFSRTD